MLKLFFFYIGLVTIVPECSAKLRIHTNENNRKSTVSKASEEKPAYQVDPNHVDKWIKMGSGTIQTERSHKSRTNGGSRSIAFGLYAMGKSVFRCSWLNEKDDGYYDIKATSELPTCAQEESFDAVNEMSLLLLSNDGSIDKPILCHNFDCKVYFGKFSPQTFRLSLQDTSVVYQGDSTMNLFLKFLLPILEKPAQREQTNATFINVSKTTVDEWAKTSFSERSGTDWISQQKLGVFPDVNIGKKHYYNDAFNIEFLGVDAPMCDPHVDFETSSSTLFTEVTSKGRPGHSIGIPIVSSKDHKGRELPPPPQIILQFHSHLHLTQIGAPFTRRLPEKIVNLQSKLEKCTEEIESAFPDAHIIPITIPAVCAQSYEGVWKNNYEHLLQGDLKHVNACKRDPRMAGLHVVQESIFDKTKEEVTADADTTSSASYACAATLMDERGARELYAREVLAYETRSQHGGKVHVLDYFIHTLDRCEYTSPGDGRHFHGAVPTLARVLMHQIQVALGRLEEAPLHHKPLKKGA